MDIGKQKIRTEEIGNEKDDRFWWIYLRVWRDEEDFWENDDLILRRGKNIEDEKEDKIQDMETKKIFEKKWAPSNWKIDFQPLAVRED